MATAMPSAYPKMANRSDVSGSGATQDFTAAEKRFDSSVKNTLRLQYKVNVVEDKQFLREVPMRETFNLSSQPSDTESLIARLMAKRDRMKLGISSGDDDQLSRPADHGSGVASSGGLLPIVSVPRSSDSSHPPGPSASSPSDGGSQKNSDLNAKQLEAALADPGKPLLVKAGAGTGKTTLVTRRLRYLIEERLIPPSRILCVSYTNTAADEMRERTTKLIPSIKGQLMFCTLHKLANLVVAAFWDRIPARSLGAFKSYKEDDQTDDQEHGPVASQPETVGDAAIPDLEQPFAAGVNSGAAAPTPSSAPAPSTTTSSSTNRRLYSKRPSIMANEKALEAIVEEGMLEHGFEVGRTELSRYLFPVEAKSEKYKTWSELLDMAKATYPDMYQSCIDRAGELVRKEKNPVLVQKKDAERFNEFVQSRHELRGCDVMTMFAGRAEQKRGQGKANVNEPTPAKAAPAASTASSNQKQAASAAGAGSTTGNGDASGNNTTRGAKKTLKRETSVLSVISDLMGNADTPRAGGDGNAEDSRTGTTAGERQSSQATGKRRKMNTGAAAAGASQRGTTTPGTSTRGKKQPPAPVDFINGRTAYALNATSEWRRRFRGCLLYDMRKLRNPQLARHEEKKQRKPTAEVKFGKNFNFQQVTSQRHWISTQKTKGYSPKDFANGTRERFAFQFYLERMRELCAMDFTDILLNGHYLLANFADIREAVGRRFCYKIVDEYQDTSIVQLEILELLSQAKGNAGKITAVGDSDQLIMSFAGSHPNTFNRFKDTFASTKEVQLEDNYRSTQSILEVAAAVLDRADVRVLRSCGNPFGLEKSVEGSVKEPVSFYRVADIDAEAKHVAELIKKTMEEANSKSSSSSGADNGRPGPVRYADFAILLRNFKFGRIQARSYDKFEDVFSQKDIGIPYKILGGISFLEHAAAQDLFAYLQLFVDPDSDAAFQRVMNEPPRGLGNVFTSLLKAEREGRGGSMFEAADRLLTNPEEALKPSYRRGLTAFMELVKKGRQQMAQKNLRGAAAHELMELVIEETNYLEASSHVQKTTGRGGGKKSKKAAADESEGAEVSSSSGESSAGEEDASEMSDAARDDLDFDSSPAMSERGGPSAGADRTTGASSQNQRAACSSPPGGRAATTPRKKVTFNIGSSRKDQRGSPSQRAAGAGENRSQNFGSSTGRRKKAEKTPKTHPDGRPLNAEEERLQRKKDAFERRVKKIVQHAKDFGLLQEQGLVLFGQGPGLEERTKPVEENYARGEEAIREYLGAAQMDDKKDPSAKQKDENKVTISTIHRAKGREWKYVFIPHLNEGFLPTIYRADDKPKPVKHVEGKAPKKKPTEFPDSDTLDMHFGEECRLMHVAITRAQRKCFVVSLEQWYAGYEAEPSSIFYPEAALQKNPNLRDHFEFIDLGVGPATSSGRNNRHGVGGDFFESGAWYNWFFDEHDNNAGNNFYSSSASDERQGFGHQNAHSGWSYNPGQAGSGFGGGAGSSSNGNVSKDPRLTKYPKRFPYKAPADGTPAWWAQRNAKGMGKGNNYGWRGSSFGFNNYTTPAESNAKMNKTHVSVVKWSGPEFARCYQQLRSLGIDADTWLDDGGNTLFIPDDTVLQKAYRLRAREVHPDKVDRSDEESWNAANEAFKILKSGYDELVKICKSFWQNKNAAD
ncbi:unnamed protein product [Amoebophrya sp. A120]|nr:unnamed protein product [Amoebophrya sp. A120]|eukprot:GSA120T00006661001.1